MTIRIILENNNNIDSYSISFYMLEFDNIYN